jgi:hypothetical protein
MMDQIAQLLDHPTEAPLCELVDNFLLGSKTAKEWQNAREQAMLTVQQHTEELRELMAKMRTFSHQTTVETVISAQSRTAALRWLIQSIEREVQRLDKAYRETAQLEQLLKDQARLSTV